MALPALLCVSLWTLSVAQDTPTCNGGNRTGIALDSSGSVGNTVLTAAIDQV
jgi:hypothetical protein